MTIPRIYSPGSLENKNTCTLADDNLRYLKNVLRLKPADKIYVFDGFGREFEATIKNFSATSVLLELGEALPPARREINITLAQAIPKAGKMDVIVKSSSELGVDSIIPFEAARSVGHIVQEKSSAKVARWQKIALEAARSSHSAYITRVERVLTFDNMISSAPEKSLKLIFWEEESQKTIRDVLTDGGHRTLKEFFIMVGPEGGFSRDEVEKTKAAGFTSVSLGRHILKVETAAAAIITIIQYERGIFSKKTQEGKP
ncbi:MAG: RsmE family RNA methyltransferase [Smithella sp.]|nr:RsmE family RNA methyltransferase [Smithella sp.]